MSKDNKIKSDQTLSILAIIGIIAIVAIVAMVIASNAKVKGEYKEPYNMMDEYKENPIMKEVQEPEMEEPKDVLGKAIGTGVNSLPPPTMSVNGDQLTIIPPGSMSDYNQWGIEIFTIYHYKDGSTTNICLESNGGKCNLETGNQLGWQDRTNYTGELSIIPEERYFDRTKELSHINIWSVIWFKSQYISTADKWMQSAWSEKVTIYPSSYKKATIPCEPGSIGLLQRDDYKFNMESDKCLSRYKWTNIGKAACNLDGPVELPEMC